MAQLNFSTNTYGVPSSGESSYCLIGGATEKLKTQNNSKNGLQKKKKWFAVIAEPLYSDSVLEPAGKLWKLFPPKLACWSFSSPCGAGTFGRSSGLCEVMMSGPS